VNSGDHEARANQAARPARPRSEPYFHGERPLRKLTALYPPDQSNKQAFVIVPNVRCALCNRRAHSPAAQTRPDCFHVPRHNSSTVFDVCHCRMVDPQPDPCVLLIPRVCAQRVNSRKQPMQFKVNAIFSSRDPARLAHRCMRGERCGAIGPTSACGFSYRRSAWRSPAVCLQDDARVRGSCPVPCGSTSSKAQPIHPIKALRSCDNRAQHFKVRPPANSQHRAAPARTMGAY